MAFQLRTVPRAWDAWPPEPHAVLAFVAPGRPLPPGAIIAISPRARASWWQLRDIAYAVPGTVIVGLDGTTLRIREDGSADVLDT